MELTATGKDAHYQLEDKRYLLQVVGNYPDIVVSGWQKKKLRQF